MPDAVTGVGGWPSESPEGVVEAAFAALRARDGRAIAALATAGSLVAYRDRLRDELRAEWYEWTPEVMQTHHPGMPPAAAAWRVEEMRRERSHHDDRVLREFGGSLTRADLDAATATDLLVAAVDAAPATVVRLAECDVLGHVVEPPDTAWVLFRLPFHSRDADGQDVGWKPEVLSVRREKGVWRLTLDAGVRFGLPGFRGSFEFGGSEGGADVS